MIQIHTQPIPAQQWLERYRGKLPVFACVLGFTETCLIPGISAAGKTPADRRYTAIADAEFLANGVQLQPDYPLPPLIAGASPVYIARAIVAALDLPLYIFNAGLPISPTVPHLDLGGMPAACVTTGAALPVAIVEALYQQGWLWGEKLAQAVGAQSYIVIGECVVGGTTTALSLLTGLGIDALGKVNSSHPVCNHQQKAAIVDRGLAQIQLPLSPLALVAAIGDPMQIVVAGMAIAASRTCGVLLAGGTQMLAVAALINALEVDRGLDVNPAQIVVGTTSWVANDRSGSGELDTDALLQAFLAFWRQHGEPLLSSAVYHEIAPHLVLMAFLHRVVNGGGILEREYAIGRDPPQGGSASLSHGFVSEIWSSDIRD